MVRNVASKIETNSDRFEKMIAELLDAVTVQGAAKIPLYLTQFNIRDLTRETWAGVRDRPTLNG